MGPSPRSSLFRRHVLTRLGVGLLVCLSVVALYIWQPRVLQQGDRQIYDIFLRRSEAGIPSPAPAIVDLDEASLKALGQWPWPRHLLAQLLKKLTESGAAAIGLDILLAEPDGTSPIHLQAALRQGFGVEVRFEGLPDHLQDNDRLLAGIMSQTPTVLGMYTQFVPESAFPLPPDLPLREGIAERASEGAPSPRSTVLRGYGATLPLPVLREAAPLGSINVAPDPDGIVRALPLLTAVGDRIIPSLSLRVLMRGLNVGSLLLIGGPEGLEALRVGPYTLPVTPAGFFQVPFRGGRGVYPYFSAVDILEGRIPTEELQGRLLLVGTSAPGLLDLRATPFDAVYPGVEVHATVMDAILSKRFLYTPSWTPGAQILGMGVVGVVGSLAFSLAPAFVWVLLLGLLAGGSVWTSRYIFQQGMYLSPLYALIMVTGLAVMLLAVRFWQENRQRRQLRQAFSRYVAPDMVDRITERGEAVLAGEEREVTLMFTDIRGFTSLSEKLAPGQVVDVLNRYFTPMTAVIRGSGGTVDKFIGDAIMAFWNAPLDVPRHELCAVRSAMDMQAALARLNEALALSPGVTLRMGVGVHTGKVYVGNMGSAELLDYTCIGDTVNLTSRLEGLCPTYGVGVVVSMDTARRCVADIPANDTRALPVFVPLDAIRVKGKNLPVEICTPLDAAEAADRREELEAFAAARTLYVAGDFAAASQAFAALHEGFANIPLYALYAGRSATLLREPPVPWEGVWTFTSK